MSRPVVIAGGGTAGHVQPALSIARALVARGRSVAFVGSRRGLEAQLVPAAGFPVTLLPGRGVVRKVSWQAAVAVLGLCVASARAVWLLSRHRPALVLSVGGYAAAPCVVAALFLRIPLVIAEQNAVPGATNRLASRWATAAAVAFEGTGLRSEVVTGTPVRAEVLAVERTPQARSAARTQLGLEPDAVVIAVTGGSLGARRINDAVVDLARRWADRPGLAIHHVVGARDWPTVSEAMPGGAPGGLVYQAVEYEHRIPLLLAAADIWVGRAGGSTIAELTAVGIPSILVPLPIAPHDHQAVQARRLESTGGCTVILDGDFDGPRLAAALDELLSDRAALAKMAAAAAAAGHRDAADRVATLIEGLIGGHVGEDRLGD